MSKHTPGPWKMLPDISGKYIAIHAGKKVICLVKVEDAADAQLIAAAPAMLEFLKNELKKCDYPECDYCASVTKLIARAAGRL